MNDKILYNFEDFTESNYRNIIQKAKKQYKFISYDEINDVNEKEDCVKVLWRHDVDVSIHQAFKLAKIENEENVKSTFFIQLSCSHYNVFEDEIKKLILNILGLGHQIGVHFDPTIYDINSEEDFERYMSFEKEVLEKLFNTEIKVFSFHNPLEEHLNLGTYEICNMVNTYSSFIQNEFEYCSDSCGYWRHKRLEDFLEKKHKKIQVLTHPEWWQDTVMSPREKILKCIKGRSEKNISLYDDSLEKLGRLNVK